MMISVAPTELRTERLPNWNYIVTPSNQFFDRLSGPTEPQGVLRQELEADRA
jgi:hypothetical protein